MKCVYSYTIITGSSAVLDIVPSKSSIRRYILEDPVQFTVETDTGILTVRTEAGFKFDGRSGPRCLDWYAPNLGSLEERMAWLMHDCLGYAQSLNFNDANRILEYFLRDICGYRKSKAAAIRLAVGLSNRWYGKPKPTEWCYCNVGKVDTVWVEKR